MSKNIMACMPYCFLLFFLVIFGQITSALSWNDAVQITKQSNNQLLSAQKQLDSTLWAYRKTYSGLLPQISASLSTQTGVVSASAAASNSFAYGISATEYLFNGPTNFYNIQAAYINYEQTKASYDSINATVLYSTRQAFIDLLIAQENVKLQQKILERRKENSRMIGLRYDSGQEDKGNLLKTQASEAQAAHNLASAKRDLRLAILNISQLLNQDISTVEEQVAFGDEGKPDYEAFLQIAPDYLVAKYNLEAADQAQKATLSEFLPTISVSGSYRKSGQSWPPNLDNNSWGLNVSLPIFPGGSNIADEIIGSINLDKAKQDLEKSRKDVRYSLAQTYEKFRQAVDSVNLSKILIAAGTERAKVDEAQYLDGLISYNDWNLAEDDYISAQINLLTTQKSALYAEAAWYKSYGGYKQ